MEYPLMAYKPKGSSARSLARWNTTHQRHLMCKQNTIILPCSDYRAWQAGLYNMGIPYSGYHYFGPPKNSYGQRCIDDCAQQAMGNQGEWIKGSYIPPFASSIGTCAIGCVTSTSTANLGLESGGYIMLPCKYFAVPQSTKRIASARIRFKGYSDRFIDCVKFRAGSSSVSSWSYNYDDYLANNSIAGTRTTPKEKVGSGWWNNYTSWAGAMLLAHASSSLNSLKPQLAFFTKYAHGVTHSDWLDYGTLLTGKNSHCREGGTNMMTYVNGMINATANPTFSGIIGCSGYTPSSSAFDTTHCQALRKANDGTVTHRNQVVPSDEWGEFMGGVGGTFMKQVGSHWYTNDSFPSGWTSISYWNIKPWIELPQHQLNDLINTGGIWIMVSNPSPWFNTTDVAEVSGGQRQIYLEDYRLELIYE